MASKPKRAFARALGRERQGERLVKQTTSTRRWPAYVAD